MGSLNDTCPIDLALSDLERLKSRSFRYWVIEERCSVNIYFLVEFDINLDITLCSLLAGGVLRCPSGLSCLWLILAQLVLSLVSLLKHCVFSLGWLLPGRIQSSCKVILEGYSSYILCHNIGTYSMIYWHNTFIYCPGGQLLRHMLYPCIHVIFNILVNFLSFILVSLPKKGKI